MSSFHVQNLHVLYLFYLKNNFTIGLKTNFGKREKLLKNIFDMNKLLLCCISTLFPILGELLPIRSVT